MRRIHRIAIVGVLSLLAGWTTVRNEACASSVIKVVDSQSAPWDWVAGGLNTGFQYGVQDSTAPTLLTAVDGLDLSAGASLTVTYLEGLTSPYGGTPYADANGDTAYVANDSGGSSGKFFPSLYIPSSSYPVYLNALVGTFADATGAIVGTPFFLGNGPTVLVVPAGATQLQLGVNDDIFSDNTGRLVVEITGLSAVPEPSTAVGLSIALTVLALKVGRRAGRKARVSHGSDLA